MTHHQDKLLKFIAAFIAANGYSPSYDEMAEHMDLASKSGVNRMVVALERLGKVRRSPYAKRSIEVAGAAPVLDVHVLAGRLATALLDAHGFDDGEDVIIAATEKELRATLLAALRP